jgi:hypothetical protein
VTGTRWISAHPDDGIPHLGRQTIDMLRVPGIVVTNLTAARIGRQPIAQAKQERTRYDWQRPSAKNPHAGTLHRKDPKDASAGPRLFGNAEDRQRQ